MYDCLPNYDITHSFVDNADQKKAETTAEGTELIDMIVFAGILKFRRISSVIQQRRNQYWNQFH